MPKTDCSIKLIFPAVAFFAFFALAGSASAATYYIKTGGNNSSACTSDATACATWAGVTAKNPAAGSDVYFKCGDTWTSTAVNSVSWSGTAAASAVISSFATNGSNTLVTTKATHGFSTGDSVTVEGTRDYDGTYTISGASGSTFVIPHAYVAGDGPGQGGLLGFTHKNLNRVVVGAYYMSGGTETVGISGNRPVLDASYDAVDNEYDGAFNVNSTYVTIENLEIKNQHRRGINCKNYTKVNNCVIHKIFTAGIVMSRNITGCIIEYNDVYDAARDEWEREPKAGNSCSTISSSNNTNYVYRYNKIHESYGEGHNHDYRSDGGLIEYNVFYDNKQTNLYLCLSRNATVRYNLSYQTNNEEYKEQDIPASGIEVALESNPTQDPNFHGNFDIYGNFIANCGVGIMMWGGLNYDPINYPVTDINIYNNTVVSSWQSAINMKQRFEDIAIKNNIFYGGSTIANVTLNYGTSYNVVFDHNLWSSQPSATTAKGAHDPAYGIPTLAKTTGWTSIAGGSLSVSDFRKQANSRGIDNGTPLGLRDYWKRTLTDIGADDYSAGGNDTSAPSAPGGLLVR